MSIVKERNNLSGIFEKQGIDIQYDLEGNLSKGGAVEYSKNKWGYDEIGKGQIKLLDITLNKNLNVNCQVIKLDNNFKDKDELKVFAGMFDPYDKHWYVPFNRIFDLMRHFNTVLCSARVSVMLQEAFNALELDRVTSYTDESIIDISDFKMPVGMKNVTLFDYQKRGVVFSVNNKRVVNGMAVGLGKTLTAITGIRQLINDGKIKRTTVIAPSSVKYSWKREIEKFSDLSCFVMSSDMVRKDARGAWKEAEKHDVLIVNYEMLNKDNTQKQLKSLSGNSVVADEAHKLKNPTKQTASFETIWKESAEYIWFLSATPYPNGQPMETYTMLSHLRKDKVGTFKEFGRRFIHWESNSFGSVPVSLKNIPLLNKLMEDVVFIRHHGSDDVNTQLPKERHITYELQMTNKQKQLYNALRDDISKELQSMEQEGIKITTNVLIAKLKKLEQIAIDPDALLMDESDVNMYNLYPKEEWALNAITDHLEIKKNKGIVVFCDTLLPLKKIHKGLSKYDIADNEVAYIRGSIPAEDRTRIENEFNTGKIKVLLCTMAAEEGMNLQKGAHTMIHMDIPWVPKKITQREGRILRTGQENKLAIFHTPIMVDTIEYRKLNKVIEKIKVIEDLLGKGSVGSAANNVNTKRIESINLSDIRSIAGV